jgi:lipoic acid synthetase
MSSVDITVDAKPDVFAHNIETIRRLTRTVRDVRSSYEQSLLVLERAKVRAKTNDQTKQLTKSSIMVGLGETDDEVVEAMRDLRGVGVDVVTIGQYLRPTPKHHEVVRFVHPDTFAMYEKEALSMGFSYAASGPLVRSSYRAAEVFLRSLLRTEGKVDEASAELNDAAVKAELEERLFVAKREAARVSLALGVPAGALEEKANPTLVPASSLVRR